MGYCEKKKKKKKTNKGDHNSILYQEEKLCTLEDAENKLPNKKIKVKREVLSVGKVAILVEHDRKAPFSIASTPRCRGGRYSIPWIAPL